MCPFGSGKRNARSSADVCSAKLLHTPDCSPPPVRGMYTMRTGGTVAEAFPSPVRLVQFLRALLTHDVRAKATAGLHHPLRGAYRLTYDTDAPTCRMFGFLNVLLAAATMANGGTDELALQVLDEANPSALEFNDTHLAWHGVDGTITIARSTLQQVREHMIVSIGSCSFTEPVDESRALGWI